MSVSRVKTKIKGFEETIELQGSKEMKWYLKNVAVAKLERCANSTGNNKYKFVS